MPSKQSNHYSTTTLAIGTSTIWLRKLSLPPCPKEQQSCFLKPTVEIQDRTGPYRECLRWRHFSTADYLSLKKKEQESALLGEGLGADGSIRLWLELLVVVAGRMQYDDWASG